jgi:hypothetical protein
LKEKKRKKKKRKMKSAMEIEIGDIETATVSRLLEAMTPRHIWRM